MKSFVIVVDVQRDFMCADGALYVPGAEALIGPIGTWLAARRAEEVAGILFTFDTHEDETYAGSAEAELFPPHCRRGTPGWETMVDASAIDPAIPLFRLEKPVFDMWAEPATVSPLRGTGDCVPRDLFFDRLRAGGVDRVEVIGVAADYCVRWAIAGLIARGFRVEVPAGLTRGIERDMEAVAADEFAGSALRVA